MCRLAYSIISFVSLEQGLIASGARASDFGLVSSMAEISDMLKQSSCHLKPSGYWCCRCIYSLLCGISS